MDRDFVINSTESCCTVNFFDNAKRYYYFINDGTLYYQREGDPVKPFPVTDDLLNYHIEKVAADSNRVFILGKNTETGERKLFWCCIKMDIAAWVKFIFKVADILTSPDENIEKNDEDLDEIDTLIKFILRNISAFKMLLINELSFILTFMEMKMDTDTLKADITGKFKTIEDEKNIRKKKRGLKDLLNFLFTFLLKNTLGGDLYFQKTSFTSFDEWVTAYTDWVKYAHQPFLWNELKRDHIKVANAHLMRKDGTKDINDPVFTLKYDDIIDIGIGNWHQTVTTFYVLISVSRDRFNTIFKDPDNEELSGVDRPGILLYLDEEPIMHFWKIVPGKMNNPYPFFNDSTIHAAHSVIAGTKKRGDKDRLFWIRHDYHNFEDFAWFPLNWTEFFFNKGFDVDTLRLYINNLDPEHNRSFVQDILIPRVFNYFFEEHTTEKPSLPESLLQIFKENDNHHPGWHAIENPAKGSHTIHIKTCMENPWPVPYINIFMLGILNFMEEYETLPIGDEKIQNYSKITDMILEMLKMLHSTALKKTKEVNRVAEISQNLGFLGENPVIPSYNYPVELITKTADSSYKITSLPSAVDTHLANWEDFDLIKKYTLKASNNKYVCFRCDKDNKLYANKSDPDNTSVFSLLRLGYDTVVFQTETGEYIVMDSSEQKNVTARKRNPGSWESFTIQPVEIAIRAANNNYLYVDTYPGKEIEVLAGKEEIEKNTVFVLTKSGDSTYKIMDKHTGRYLVAQQNENRKILTNIETPLLLSNFTFMRTGFDRWAIKTKKGYYMSLDTAHNSIITGPRIPGTNELFTITFLKVALRTQSGQFLTKSWLGRSFIAGSFDSRRSLFEIRDINNIYFK